MSPRGNFGVLEVFDELHVPLRSAQRAYKLARASNPQHREKAGGSPREKGPEENYSVFTVPLRPSIRLALDSHCSSQREKKERRGKERKEAADFVHPDPVSFKPKSDSSSTPAAMSQDDALQVMAASALEVTCYGIDRPSSYLTASTCQFSNHDDNLPSTNNHVESLGRLLRGADSGLQSSLLLGPSKSSHSKIDLPEAVQSNSLPPIEFILKNIPNATLNHAQFLPATCINAESYGRAPNSLLAYSLNRFASNGSMYRSPAEYPADASTRDLQPRYISSSPATITSVPDRTGIDRTTSPRARDYRCKFFGCTGQAFQTKYLRESHAKVHSSTRPHYCSVTGCPRAEGGEGFKRKNEMTRHVLAHNSPEYRCPFCAGPERKYLRPDNLQRYVSACCYLPLTAYHSELLTKATAFL
jgi:hypothetical protein